MRIVTEKDKQKASCIGMSIRAYLNRVELLEKQIRELSGKEKRIGKSK